MTGLEVSGSVVVGPLRVSVELAVASGETVAVLGPNGAGKTSLLRVVSGLLPLTEGVVRLDGRTLDDPGNGVWVPPEDRSIGLVFQDLLLFPGLSVLDNVAFAPRARGIGARAARATANDWLERLGASTLRDVPVERLSGGEAQRVALARALAADPKAILLDEPLAALDADVRTQVRRQLRDHLRGHQGPRVLVSHDPLDAAVLADRVVVLEDGQITAAGALSDLVARPRTTWAAQLAGTNLLPAMATRGALALASGGELLGAGSIEDGGVLVAIRPASIALHLHRPEGSARNVWPATVVEVEGFAERYRVRLIGPVPVVAEVTGAALEELHLQPGREVWASVKATDVVAYPT